MSAGAFDLLDRPLIYIPVTWKGLTASADESARVVDHKVSIQIELLDRDEFSEWIVAAQADVQRLTDELGNPDPADTRTDAEILAERAAHELATFRTVAKGWRGIKAGGKSVEFSDEHIAKLLRWPGFVTAFGNAYMEAWRGELKTREGNFDGSGENGQAAEPTDATPKGTTSPQS